jgi:hypothetical protein
MTMAITRIACGWTQVSMMVYALDRCHTFARNSQAVNLGITTLQVPILWLVEMVLLVIWVMVNRNAHPATVALLVLGSVDPRVLNVPSERINKSKSISVESLAVYHVLLQCHRVTTSLQRVQL